jgi:hypothetical protein
VIVKMIVEKQMECRLAEETEVLGEIFIITRGWQNRPGVAAVPITSQSRIKKN